MMRLTSLTTATRRFIMQKARRHMSKHAPTACRRMGSGTISLPCQGCFSPFPHGTCTLSVSQEYLALPDGPGGFTQDYTCPALLRRTPAAPAPSPRGLSPATVPLSNGSGSGREPRNGGPTTPSVRKAHGRFGLFPGRSPLLGESFVLFSSSGY